MQIVGDKCFVYTLLNSLRLSTTLRWMKRIILLKFDMRIFKVQLTCFCFDMALQNLPDRKHCEL